MLSYTFDNRDEFVRYLDSMANQEFSRASTFTPRSHAHAEHQAAGRAFEKIAAMVRRSNLVTVASLEMVEHVSR